MGSIYLTDRSYFRPGHRSNPRHRKNWRLASVLSLLFALMAGACSDETTSIPSIGFLFPVDSSTITPEGDIDSDLPGIQVDVQVAVLSFGDTGSLTLQVGGDAESLVEQNVSGDATYLFESFTLPEGQVQLVAQLLDDDGDVESTARISTFVSGAVSTPSIDVLSPADGANLTLDDDVDPDTDGIQLNIVTVVLGWDRAGTLALQVDGDAETRIEQEVSSDAIYRFSDYTLPDGDITLTLELLDADGESRATSQIDVSVSSEPPLPPSIEISSPDSDGQLFTLDDDVDDDAFNGLQIDVDVVTTSVPEGTELRLFVGAAASPIRVDAGATGATFEGVTLPNTGTDAALDLHVEVTVEEGAGTTTIDGRRTLSTDIECVLALEPEPAGGVCDVNGVSTDADEDLEGFQQAFVVRTNCARAELTVNGDRETGFVSEGEADFEVTLDQGENVVVAAVFDDNPSRTEEADPVLWTVDVEPPVIAITSPSDGQRLFFDRDEDPENGFQVSIDGTVEGAAPGAEIELRVDGAAAGTTVVNDEGDGFVGEATVAAGGAVSLTAAVSDDCANTAEADAVAVTVVSDLPTVTIVNPATETALLADGDDGGDYETDFQLAVSNLEAGVEVDVLCRRPAGLFAERGSATSDGTASLTVPVVLPVGELFCRAQFTLDEAVFDSEVIRIFLDNVAPTVAIVSPEDGTVTTATEIDVGAFVTTFDPEGPVTVTVNDVEVSHDGLDAGALLVTVPIEEGANTIVIAAQEVLDPDGLALTGNAGSDTITVSRDTQAPVVSIVHPAGDFDETDPRLDANFFYDVLVSSNEVGDDAEVCLTANGGNEICVTATLNVDVWEAAFDDVFMLPGSNTLSARAVDDAGNEGTVQVTVDFDTTAARLEWDRIEFDAVTVTPLDGAVISTSGTVDLVMTTDLAVGATVNLELNGSQASSADADASGVVRFTDVQLANETELAGQGGQNELVASLDSDATQRSATARIRVDTAPPTIAFSELTDGADLTLANTTDVSAAAGFQIDVALTATEVEDGQQASVTIDCATQDSFDDVYTGAVTGNAVSIEITIPGEDTCTLTADVSDEAGNSATPAVISVDVDVQPPTCAFAAPTEGLLIDDSLDEVFGDEIQYDIEVTVGGASGDVNVVAAGGIIDPLSMAAPGGGSGTVVFDDVTLPDGDLSLTATVVDAAGNACEAQVNATVFSPDVALGFFGLSSGDSLNISDDRQPGVPGFQGDFQVIATAAFPGEVVTMCRAIAEGGAGCSDAQFEILGTAIMSGTSAIFTNIALPEDPNTTLLAELDLGATILRTAPLNVCVDTVRPTIDSWSLDNDLGVEVPGLGTLGAGDGALNLAEAADRRADLTLELGGLATTRTVQIFSNLVTGGPVATGSTNGTLTISTSALPQGQQTLRAQFTDACGNPPAAASPTLSVTIDTIAPTLAWSNPTNGGSVLAADDTSGDPGAQITISLLTDVIEGAPVAISGLTLLAPPTEEPDVLLVDDDGRVEGVATLAEGTAELSAVVFDGAFNASTADSTVLVDVTAPTISVALAGPVADVDGSTPGYQLDFDVSTTEAETGRTVNFDSTAAGGQFGSTTVGTTAGGDQAWSDTVRLTMPIGEQEVTATVADTSGNQAISAPVPVTIDVTGCGLVFVSPPGSPVLVDSSDYGGSGPKTVDAQVDVLDIDGCADQADPASVRVRIGCDVGDADGACTRVTSVDVDSSGQALFTGVNALEFFDGEVTTMHAIVVHPTTDEVSATPQKQVIVDLIDPVVTITRPGVAADEMTLSRRDTIAGTDWSRDGTTVVGPLTFDATDVFGVACEGVPGPRPRCSYTVRYGGGTVLSDGSGPIQNRAINTAGVVPVSLSGVRYPTLTGTNGTTLEVQATDEAGNVTVSSVALNVDAAPPTAPSNFDIDGSAHVDEGRERSGRSDLGWTGSTDGSSDTGAVSRYEIRARCLTRTTRTLIGGAPLTDCAGGWFTITDWEQRPLVAEITDGSVTYFLDHIGLDEAWEVAVRAFDEADNWSTVAPATELPADTIGTIDTTLNSARLVSDTTFLGASTNGLISVGDLNGDGRDDLVAASGFGAVVVMLGELDPTSPTIAGNPFTIEAPDAAALFFGSAVFPVGDVNGDELADFAVGSPGIFGDGDNVVYLFFGGDPFDPSQTPVGIVGPSDRFFELGIASTRTGSGNFFDVAGETGGPYDDLYLVAPDVFFEPFPSDIYVLAGRSAADWAATPTIDLSAGTAAAACDVDAIRIEGSFAGGPEPLPTEGFGLDGGLVDLDGDGYVDVVAGTLYTETGSVGTPDPSYQYIFYGDRTSPCPDGGWSISDRDEEEMNTGGDTPNAEVPRTTQVGVNTDGVEYAVGFLTEDVVEVHGYDDGVGMVTLIQGISPSVDLGAVRFGTGVNFAGDLDRAGGADLVVGAPAPSSAPNGRVYVVSSTGTAARFGSIPDFWLATTTASRRFGDFIAAGFDYNGDGSSDFAVSDSGDTAAGGSIWLFY